MGHGLQEKVNSFYLNYPYPLISSPFSRQHRQFVRKLVSLMGLDYNKLDGLEILDAGCGTGEKSVILANMGAKVTSVDINPGQLKRAKLLASKYNLKINFRQEDLVSLSLDKKFDAILCSGVLHHTPDPHKAFESLCAHLKPGGRILIGLYNSYSRIHYRAARALLHARFNSDPEKIMDFVEHSRIAAPLRTASLPTLYDRYAVPHESYHTIGEMRTLFAKNNIELDTIYPEAHGNDVLAQLNWLRKGKSFFFVSGRKIN